MLRSPDEDEIDSSTSSSPSHTRVGILPSACLQSGLMRKLGFFSSRRHLADDSTTEVRVPWPLSPVTSESPANGYNEKVYNTFSKVLLDIQLLVPYILN